MLNLRMTQPVLAVCLAAACTSLQAVDVLVPVGSKATLTVEYLYESAGSKRSEGMYDPYQWRVKRSASLVAELAAKAPTAMPTLQAMDAAHMAELGRRSDKHQAVAAQAAPMLADINAIMAKCGDNEACLAREAQKMGAAIQSSPQKAAAMGKTQRDVQELSKPDAPRYQAWRATAQKGSYLIDETAQISVTDPICIGKPRNRCSRNEVRQGAGEIVLPADKKKNPAAAAGLSAAELDSAKNTLTLILPMPMTGLPYTETITTDEPEGTHSTPTPKGPQARQHWLRVTAAGGMVTSEAPIKVALKGGWRSQNGEQVAMLKGEFGDAGQLTVRWRFNVQ